MDMQIDNIYRFARKLKGLTQAEAAHRIGTTSRSISDYENIKYTVSNEVAAKMVEAYDAEWLACLHFANDKHLGKYFPKIDFKDIAQAALRMQKEVSDFNKITPDMIDVAYDGVIEEHEKKTWSNVTVEAMDIAGAAWTLMLAGVISNSI